jgi:hypothetical protein
MKSEPDATFPPVHRAENDLRSVRTGQDAQDSPRNVCATAKILEAEAIPQDRSVVFH